MLPSSTNQALEQGKDHYNNIISRHDTDNSKNTANAQIKSSEISFIVKRDDEFQLSIDLVAFVIYTAALSLSSPFDESYLSMHVKWAAYLIDDICFPIRIRKK
jgi:hypothetical protein